MSIPKRFESIGRVLNPETDIPWAVSHAALPCPIHLEQDTYRVLFAARDEDNRSMVGWADIELRDPPVLLGVSDGPVLEPGGLGEFDDHGVYAASAVLDRDHYKIYTIGWNPGKTPPLFYATIGLAYADSSASRFWKAQNWPILARGRYDPCLVTSPVVVWDGTGWSMYYVSGYRWEARNGRPQSYYNIKHATSRDGATWHRDGAVIMDGASKDEVNISRFWVQRDGQSNFIGWFSSCQMGQPYRIRSAASDDGLIWSRDDRFNFVPSRSDWDSEMQAYPAVVRHGGIDWMLYNGNGFGRTGIGIARAS